MRTNFLKMILPVMVIMLAVAGAFASQKPNTSVLAPATGWIDTPLPCSVAVSCNTTNGPVCTALINGVSHQAYGKFNPTDMTCTKILFRN